MAFCLILTTIQTSKQSNKQMNAKPPEHLVHEKISIIYYSVDKLLKYDYHVNMPVFHHQKMYFQAKNLNSSATIEQD